MQSEGILQILGKSHALKILQALDERPLRFIDLDGACRSNRTRSARLKELQGKGLIRAIPKMIGGRAYTYYELTTGGKEALDICKKLEQLEKK